MSTDPSDVMAVFDQLLPALRTDVDRALHSTDVAEPAIRLLGTTLRVDQVRGIVSSQGDRRLWQTRQGQSLIANDSAPGRDFLGFVVGSERFLTPQGCLDVFASLVTGTPRYAISEIFLACFVNVFVIESHRHPEKEQLILAVLGVEFEDGDKDENLYPHLPPLLTDFDPLYSEIPQDAAHSAKLRPNRGTRTIEQCRQAVLEQVVPMMDNRPVGRSSIDALWDQHSTEIDHYVRTHVVDVVAALTSAGDRGVTGSE